MVAMVNHTALAALHVGSRLGGDEPGKDTGIQVQEGGEDGKEDGWENASFQKGDVSWVEPGGSWENTTGGQVDGPFVWETTVGWNNFTNQTICVQEQGYVLSAYFVGYFITQVLGILFSTAR